MGRLRTVWSPTCSPTSPPDGSPAFGWTRCSGPASGCRGGVGSTAGTSASTSGFLRRRPSGKGDRIAAAPLVPNGVVTPSSTPKPSAPQRANRTLALAARPSGGPVPHGSRVRPTHLRAISRNRSIQRVQADPASRRLWPLDAPPAGDVALVVRIHTELVWNRTGDIVVDRADRRLDLGIHGRNGVDDSPPACRCRRAACHRCGPASGERPWFRGGFRAHAGARSTSAAEDPSPKTMGTVPLRASKSIWELLEPAVVTVVQDVVDSPW